MPGVVANGVYFNTDSGLNAPGGFLDRLTQTADTVANNNAQLAGLAPALQATGLPVSTQQPGILSRLVGLGGAPAAPGAPATGGGLLSSLFGGASPAATQASAPTAQPAPAMPMQVSSNAGPSSGPDSNAIANLIGTTAQKYGIDPLTAIRVARSEGGLRVGVPGDGGSSIGPFQLHYGNVAGGGNSGKGLGDSYTADTGFQAGDPAHLADEVDYALRYASKNGWSAFHGAAKAGIGALAGIGVAPGGGGVQPASYGQPGPTGGPMPQATAGNSQGSGASPPQLGGNQASPPPSGPMPIATASGSAQPSYNGQPAPAGTSASPPGGLALRGGMTKEALAAMIANPATRADGLALWKNSLTRQYTFANGPEGSGTVLREDPIAGTATPVFQAPLSVHDDTTLYDQNRRAPIFTAPSKSQVVQIGTDDYGQPKYGMLDPVARSIVPLDGQGVPAQPASGAPSGQPSATPAGAAGSGPVDRSKLTGPALLASLAPPIAGQVQAIAEGRMKLPSGNGANSPQAQRMRAFVLQYDPSFDQADVDARFNTRQDFAKGSTADTIVAGNTALEHLGKLSDAAEDLGNSNIPALNALSQAAGSATGGNIAGKQFANTLNDFTGELVKFYRGTGGSEADITAAKTALDPSQSPAQLRAGIAQQAALIYSKVNALQNRWKTGMGPNAAPYPIIAPETQTSFSRIMSRFPTGSMGGSRSGSGGAPAPSQALPTASPAGSGGQMPRLTDPTQVRSLPSGTRFLTPDGRTGVAP